MTTRLIKAPVGYRTKDGKQIRDYKILGVIQETESGEIVLLDPLKNFAAIHHMQLHHQLCRNESRIFAPVYLED